MTTVRDLDRIVRTYRLLQHPFYRAWSNGTLPRTRLREFAEQYSHVEANFARYVAAGYARILRPADRSALLRNLVDEEGRSPTCPELWERFARAMGAPPLGPATPILPATRRLLKAYDEETLGGSAASALAALYAYESQLPEIATEMSRGLRENYGIRAADTLEFFTRHSEAGPAHAGIERSILAREITDPEAALAAVRGVRHAAAAWWKFLESLAP